MYTHMNAYNADYVNVCPWDNSRFCELMIMNYDL